MRQEKDGGGRNSNETECSDLGRVDCFKVDIQFDNVDRSDRLKVFCTSMEKKFDVANQTKATTSYEVNYRHAKDSRNLVVCIFSHICTWRDGGPTDLKGIYLHTRNRI